MGDFFSAVSATKKRCKLKAISGVAILRDAGTSTPTSSAGATKVGVPWLIARPWFKNEIFGDKKQWDLGMQYEK